MTAKHKVQVGDKFNKLTVTQIVSEPRKNGKSKRRFLLCTCECGGQIKREPAISFVVWFKAVAVSVVLAMVSATRLNTECMKELNGEHNVKDYLLILNCDIIIPKRCPLLDIPLQDCKGAAGDSSPSLDRLLPHLGYVKGNIIVISHRANQIKNCASVDELMLIADNLHSIITK